MTTTTDLTRYLANDGEAYRAVCALATDTGDDAVTLPRLSLALREWVATMVLPQYHRALPERLAAEGLTSWIGSVDWDALAVEVLDWSRVEAGATV